MVWLWIHGSSVRNISKRFGASPSTVYRWIRRWQDDGLLEDKLVLKKRYFRFAGNQNLDNLSQWLCKNAYRSNMLFWRHKELYQQNNNIFNFSPFCLTFNTQLRLQRQNICRFNNIYDLEYRSIDVCKNNK